MPAPFLLLFFIVRIPHGPRQLIGAGGGFQTAGVAEEHLLYIVYALPVEEFGDGF